MVSTGYETLPRERITGSFEHIDEQLFNRSVGMDVLSRLDGITTALHFDKRGHDYNTTSNPASISLRGPSTISANAQPLIVLDNFPYEGDPALINPNEVASITLLKDAAAASIWGARAGNGVIVITTKRANLNRPTLIQVNTTMSVAEKLDLYASQPLSSDDYIDVEQFLFERGFYDNEINSPSQSALSPVIELLWKVREGSADADSAQNIINGWKINDVINDFQRHIYRHPVDQQYSLTVSGGGGRHGYIVMGGFDKNREPLRSNSLQRFNFRADNKFKVTDRLEVQTGIRFTSRNIGLPLPNAGTSYEQFVFNNKPLYPYARLADDNNNPLSIPRDFRESYTATTGDVLLEWGYRPLDEINYSRQRNSQDIRLEASASYRILPGFRVGMQYMQYFNKGSDVSHYPAESYYARNLTNLFTQVVNGEAFRIIPVGGVMQQSGTQDRGFSVRGQANYDRQWGSRHRVAALAGSETRQARSLFDQQLPVYGYNASKLTYSAALDYQTRYPIYDGLRSNQVIPGSLSLSDRMNRFVSLFANISYTYLDRYVISASARRDASNIFGVKHNQKWTPLWSVGLSWLLSDESFFSLDLLPYMKARITYGYSGNINPAVSAHTTLNYSARQSTTGLPYASAGNPPNPSLRWEQVRTFNAGLDFESADKHVSGTLEYYVKLTRDLFANELIDPTLGFGTSAVTNSAHMRGKGFDLTLRTINLTETLRWNTHFVLSYNQTKVTKYMQSPTSVASNYISGGLGINPIVGSVAYPIYSYRWAGLDPETGDPVGYLNGERSTNYRDIRRETPFEDLVFHGSARPLYAGAVRNELGYGPISFSFNLTWAGGHFYRRPSLSYQNLFNSGVGHAEFRLRWQQSGDELRTAVPSMVYPLITDRDNFYRDASINVVKGDHIRIQDLRLAYRLDMFTLYAYANNIGVLWTASKEGIDPVYRGGIYPARSYSIGINLQL